MFYVAATLVALSRISLGRHYPSDVLAGAALGLMAGFAGTLLANRARRIDRSVWPRALALLLLVPAVWILSTHRGTIRHNFLILGCAVLLALLIRSILARRARRNARTVMQDEPEP